MIFPFEESKSLRNPSGLVSADEKSVPTTAFQSSVSSFLCGQSRSFSTTQCTTQVVLCQRMGSGMSG